MAIPQSEGTVSQLLCAGHPYSVSPSAMPSLSVSPSAGCLAALNFCRIVLRAANRGAGMEKLVDYLTRTEFLDVSRT
jgi:hypothetical protein